MNLSPEYKFANSAGHLYLKSIGDQYEQQALLWLQDRGLELLTTNYRSRTGEIDIIGIVGSHLVFFEVRARSNPRYAGAAASVDPRKQRRLIHTAQWYLLQHPEFRQLPSRFDVIAIQPRQSSDDIGIEWIRGAFSA